MEGMELSPQAVNVLLILAYLGGVIARIAWPYALAYLKEPQKFDWSLAKGQIIGAVVGLAGIFLSTVSAEGFVASLGALGYVGAFIAGFGAAAFGREGQKTAGIRKARK